ncbi:taurine catabolism dioxygenase [Gonapodya prolifera JEL478]|uniref:Taurine catabolism dioxygenase n=1 Tax=Gonapodya prolifera (strain JEL478) TaxID=1344416 RepID=A0A139A0R8_GONPJ|nr:taurine catabolism dioxygenase [Gonapodya prolifera JEL478]|eukprot:KXS10377.1 taurine catabolism dioxygenase [Gonapodya prolifera JEL478]
MSVSLAEASKPRVYSGSLDAFPSFRPTPQIGIEFGEELQIAALSDAQVQDLAILASQHGVVFLRGQNLSAEQQIAFGAKIASNGWHSDVTFEPTPPSYAALRLETIPETGGDTLWSSGYAAYSRLSAPLRHFLETLHAEHDANHFHVGAKRAGIEVRTDRGGEGNDSLDLRAVHPVVRTNPVTGWKALFVNKVFTHRIVELSKTESDALLNFLYGHIANGFDFQVRFKWSPGAVALWDNRSVHHTATRDFDPAVLGSRIGYRITPVGEKPYLDPASRSTQLGL